MAIPSATARTTTHNPQPANPQPVPPPAASDESEATLPLFASTDLVPEDDNPSPRDRAFGIARWWTDLRKENGEPVVAGGKNGPLHPVRSLIEQFTPHYSDDEIRDALTQIDRGFPAKPKLEEVLVQRRREQQGKRPALPTRYEPRGTAPQANQQVVRESAEARKARGWLALPTGGVQ